MQNITLRSHVGKDGILHLDIPVGLIDAELEVKVSVQPVGSPSEVDSPQGKGWPPGFFEETFGCFKDDPLVVDSEGVFEEREELQWGICSIPMSV